MSSSKKLSFYLDDDDDEPVTSTPKKPATSTPKKASSRRPSGFPRSKNRRPATDEPDDDDEDQIKPVTKRERCGSLDSDEETPKKRRAPAPTPESTFKQLVAIDFGMWGCGMSMSPPCGHPKDVKAHTTWPKNKGAETSKFPAIIALAEDNAGHKKFKNRNEPYTAFETPAGTIKVSFPKICMARDIAPSPFDDLIFKEEISRKLVNPLEQAKNEKAMVEILKYTRKVHATEAVKSLGRELQADDAFHFVFTYPAACSEAGKRTLRNAVKLAGFEDRKCDKITYISEAHGAASAAFIDSRSTLSLEEWKKIWKKGKAVTVIDFGALTVDATTITMRGTDSQLSIAEAKVSNGGNCGTTAIICRILKCLEDELGPLFSAVPPEQLDRGTDFYQDCENILRTYDEPSPGEKHNFRLKLPKGFTHPNYDARTGEVFLADSEVQRAFDETLSYIMAILRDQWKGMPEKTDAIPTGGGSHCPYIDEEMFQFCANHGRRYVRTSNRDSAVSRGALISVMKENFFGWRLSRAYFGILVQDGDQSYIKWFVLRGERINVKKGTTFSKCFGKLILDDNILQSIFYGMDLDRPHLPIYSFHAHLNESQALPDQPTDLGVEEVGRIIVDRSGFSKACRERLERGMSSGLAQSLKASLAVTVDGSGRLFFVLKANRNCIGRGELRYDATEVDPQPPSW